MPESAEPQRRVVRPNRVEAQPPENATVGHPSREDTEADPLDGRSLAGRSSTVAAHGPHREPWPAAATATGNAMPCACPPTNAVVRGDSFRVRRSMVMDYLDCARAIYRHVARASEMNLRGRNYEAGFAGYSGGRPTADPRSSHRGFRPSRVPAACAGAAPAHRACRASARTSAGRAVQTRREPPWSDDR